MPKIITREGAIALGLKRYFTGEPCKHGHVCERYLSGQCVDCQRAHSRRQHAANPEKHRAESRKRYAANPEKHRAYSREWRAENPEIKREAGRKWAAANPEKRRAASRKHYAANPDKSLNRIREWNAAHPEKKRAAWRLWKATNLEKLREISRNSSRNYRATHSLMRDILLEMGLIRKEDTPAEQRGLVRAYVKLGLLNREEIEEWLNTKTLKKA
jgi:hypothetical protein